MRNAVVVIVLAGCVIAAERVTPATPAGNVDWIAGYWLSCDGPQQTAEAWIGAGSGLLVGANHGRGEGEPTFEYMRIGRTTDGGLGYFASPAGAPAVVFAMKSLRGQRIVFENAAHDFPQRVIYERRGNELTGRIEGVADGRTQSMEWRYRAAPLGENCGKTGASQ